MDKKTNKATEKAMDKTQKGMNRTEFAQEYSIETGKSATKQSGSANKNGKTNKTN